MNATINIDFVIVNVIITIVSSDTSGEVNKQSLFLQKMYRPWLVSCELMVDLVGISRVSRDLPITKCLIPAAHQIISPLDTFLPQVGTSPL